MLEAVLNSSFYGISFYSLPFLVAGLLIALLGFTAFFYERRLRVKVPFFLLTFSAAIWLLSYAFLFSAKETEAHFQVYLCKIAHIGVSLIPGLMLLFVASIFQAPQKFRAWAYFNMGAGLFFCGINLGTNLWFQDVYQYAWGAYPRYKPFSTVFLIFFFIALLSGIGALGYGYHRAASQRSKKRLKSLLIAFSVSLLASVDYLPNYGISLYPVGYIGIFIFFAMVSRTMQRYHLSDLSPAFASEQILETMQGVVLVLDMDGVVCVANKFACEILGYQKKELIGKQGNQIIKLFEVGKSVEDCPLAKYLLKDFQKPIRAYPMRWLTKKNEWIELSVSASVLFSQKNNKAEGIIYTALDLTERVRAEEELRSIQDRFQLVTENARDYAFFMLGPQGIVETWNLGAERMKKYSAEEIIGKHFSCFYPKEDVDAGVPERAFASTLENGYMESEGWRVRKDGSKFWAHVSMTALKDGAGRLQGILKITRDITHRKLLEEERERNREKMQEAEEILRNKKELEMKSNFISMVSHELRTPLTSIKMSVDILKDQEAGPLSSQQMEWVDMCLRNIDRLTRLINRVLDFQKLESGKWAYEVTEVDINELVHEHEKQMQLLLGEKKVCFKMDLAPGRLMARVDCDKITEVLTNILSNAAKFTSSGSITLRTEKKDGKIRITVADTGIGIQEEDLSRVFSSFTQVHGPEHKTGGTGLGLAISRKIVEQLDGKIWVESEYGKGSTFFIDIPALNDSDTKK